MNPESGEQEKDKIDSGFLLKDYEIKVKYLSDHFQRKWSRFNFFVVIESALIGGRFIAGDGKLTAELALAGGVLSLVWYIFGAQDRWLVRLYRNQAEEAAERAAKQAGIPEPDYQFYTGSTPVGGAPHTGFISPAEWQSTRISITRLAALFPAFIFLVWAFLFLLMVSSWPDGVAKELEQ